MLYVKKNLDAQFVGKEMKWEWNVYFVWICER